MYFQEGGCEDAGWIELAHERVQWGLHMKTKMNFWVSYKVGNLLTNLVIIGSSSAELHEVNYSQNNPCIQSKKNK
jgi:hypothetical protein